MRDDEPEEIAAPPAPLCELCGVPFDPNAPEPQTCGGMPCLLPENELVDWVMRVRAMPTAQSPLGRWPAPDEGDLLVRQAERLAVIAAELARDLGARLVPQFGPYCSTYVRRVPALQLSERELEIIQRAWHYPGSADRVRISLSRIDQAQAEELERVWARVARHLLETICQRLQAEYR